MKYMFAFIILLGVHCVVGVLSFADESLLLAYQVDIEVDGGSYVLQERGRRISKSQPIVVAMGSGGRGKFVIHLENTTDDGGKVLVELFDDSGSELSKTLPIYSLHSDFVVGLPGEIRSTTEEVSIDLAFNLVKP